MLILRCTSKLLKELDVHKSTLSEWVEPDNLLGSWYANIIRIDRRKCLLFVNDKTLFTFLIFGVKKSDLKNFKELFLKNLKLNLRFLGIKQRIIEQICDDYTKYKIGKTSSNRVVGSMNMYGRYYKFMNQHRDVPIADTILESNSDMNKMPIGAIGYSNAEKMLIELLDGAAQ